MDCVFCAIVAGKIPCHRIAEDDHTLAFLDIGPLRPGHALVISKRHAGRLQELSASEAGAILQSAHALLPAIAAATGDADATLAIHNGRAAGQEVPHVHLHIIPRAPQDGGGPVHALFSSRAPVEGVEAMANAISDAS